MGIPAAFRWLSTKYPKIISPVMEDQPISMEDGTVIPVDTTQPNPNGEEFDNLYLDMNGIVHPCSHPEDKPAPKDEEEMMLEIFKYTDRVVNMVRPRKLLMIAVDGVAPRAKMNQQRSRRFRAAQEAQQKEEDKQELLQLLKRQNGGALEQGSLEAVAKKAFDSNSITPGTPFMDILAASLRYWCSYKLNTDPAWAMMKIIISDATVPGEGEHKIMEFVRSQRGSAGHNPNTRHVIYGLDADLIMLGLATHEPHFRVLREDVFFQERKARMCKICGQKGHDERSCKGEAKKKSGDFDEKDHAHPLKPFIWLHVSILREYLAVELDVPALPFRLDLERAIDDWVFMCFFVGNDFLPHLPALEIRENGIDTLTAIWKDNLAHMGGYMTKDGRADLERTQYILTGLAKQEDAIFRRRKESEDRREAGFKRRKLQQQQNGGRAGHNGGGMPRGRKSVESLTPAPILELHPIASFPSKYSQPITHDTIVSRRAIDQVNVANKSAASVLKSQILGSKTRAADETVDKGKDGADAGSASSAAIAPAAAALGKRKASALERDDATGTNEHGTRQAGTASTGSNDDEPHDNVRLWEEGYADRYYQQKFHVDPKDIGFRQKVARAYAEGLCWVLMYYFQGCPSWEWYYPYHYAPFAADFVDLGKMEIKFSKGRISRPFEQLMSVLPAASRHAIPEVFHELMTKEDSDIIDFYPADFEVDLNGKKMAWQGVALLPFIDMPRLLAAMDTKYPMLSAEDQARNEVGKDVLMLSDAHAHLYELISSKFYSKKQSAPTMKLEAVQSDGLAGTLEKIEGYYPHGSLSYPLGRCTMPDVDYDRSLSVHYEVPSSARVHKSMLLRGVKLPQPALERHEVATLHGKAASSGRSYGGAPLHNNNARHSGNGHAGGRREPINYGPNSDGSRPDRRPYPRGQNSSYPNDGAGGRGRGHSQPGPPGPPGIPGWHAPPPPGSSYFGRGMPPPPPPVHMAALHYGGNAHGGGYVPGYGLNDFSVQPRHSAPGMHHSSQQYSGQHNHYNHGGRQYDHRGRR